MSIPKTHGPLLNLTGPERPVPPDGFTIVDSEPVEWDVVWVDGKWQLVDASLLIPVSWHRWIPAKDFRWVAAKCK